MTPRPPTVTGGGWRFFLTTPKCEQSGRTARAARSSGRERLNVFAMHASQTGLRRGTQQLGQRCLPREISTRPKSTSPPQLSINPQ